MQDIWMPSEDELNALKSGDYNAESMDEMIDRLNKATQYLMGESEQRRQRSKAYAEKQAVNPHRFVRFYRMKNKELSKSNMLNNTDKAFLFDVLPYINRESNMITDDVGIPMVAKDICRELNIGKNTFYTTIKRLIECGVITQVQHKKKTVYFKINPEYFDY